MLALLVVGCANFRKLGRDLKLMKNTYVASALVRNAGDFPNVYGVVIEWDNGRSGTVHSADFSEVGNIGLFGFLVERNENQYIMAFSDENNSGIYDQGEAAWIHTGGSGQPEPLDFNIDGGRAARAFGELSKSVVLPIDMIAAARDFKGARTAQEAASGMAIPVALGDLAELDDDDKFAAVRGEEGLWQPATFPLELGLGIYFLEEYDPNRIPVLFVYGAAGSPQDWRPFFNNLDTTKYQAWFYFYPTGARLEKAGAALNRGVQILQAHYAFNQLHVVAHSMGGLVSRSFVIENVLEGGNRYIEKFVTISTPWNGHEAAELGVKMAPKVVPSWYDMQTDSDFQKQILSRKLEGKVDHLILYGNQSSSSRILPDENDGTVSVDSMTYKAAVKDSVEIVVYDADHVNILSREDVIAKVHAFLAGE